MARIQWDAVGEKYYELGVDRGVLYTGPSGVPWNGLVSINEEPTGGETKDYYIDGIKYLSLTTSEEFGATIEAYTYPNEFAECDGTARIANGLYAAQQSRRSFGLSYRTKIGNDIDGPDHAYKVHLIYNCTALPSTRTRNSIGESVEASAFSWKVATRPPPLSGYSATAHFEIDSRETPSVLLKQIEDVLYGSGAAHPRFPSVDELMQLFKSYSGPIDPTDPTDPGTIPPVVDNGTPTTAPTRIFDGGSPTTSTTTTLDGGAPT